MDTGFAPVRRGRASDALLHGAPRHRCRKSPERVVGCTVAVPRDPYDLKVLRGSRASEVPRPPPAGAPYDRIHMTAGVRRIPAAWLEQAAPGAILLLPGGGTDYSPHDAALRLVVEGPGRACGPFTMALSFMKLRAQRAVPAVIDLPEGWPDAARVCGTELGLADVVGGPYDPVEFVLGLCVPDCVPVVVPGEGAGEGTLWLTAAGADPSVAAAGFARGRRANVLQVGPRSLWTEVEDAYRWWDRAGRPDVFDFGLAVTVTDGEVHQAPWHDNPQRELPDI
ncbi:hypothetical protein [Streptomyces sp. SID3343]|uniref:hypothetical protein n=1 Tax=Streptomyces sp. SID3343 TaxID=2690260 RepID=UPI0023512A2E|nr:hypothetical protein [Streptomyces sp. SID3343]